MHHVRSNLRAPVMVSNTSSEETKEEKRAQNYVNSTLARLRKPTLLFTVSGINLQLEFVIISIRSNFVNFHVHQTKPCPFMYNHLIHFLVFQAVAGSG